MHHAQIFMEKDVAMKHKRAGNCGIAEIETALETMVRMAGTLPEGNLEGVTQILILNRLPVHFQNFEVYLVDVKSVSLERAILHDPIFDGTHVSRDHRFFVGFKHLLLLSVDSDVELDRTIGPAKFLGEVKFAECGWLHLIQSSEFYGAKRRAAIGLWRHSLLRLFCI